MGQGKTAAPAASTPRPRGSEDHLPNGRRGVHGLSDGRKVHAELPELLQGGEQVSGGADEAVKAPHGDNLDVALACLPHQVVEGRTALLASRDPFVNVLPDDQPGHTYPGC